jgi:hypothetical protein
MNVNATQMPRVPAQGAANHRGLDVTVSDGGVEKRAPLSRAADAAPVAATVTAPTSTLELAITLSTDEQSALTDRFASLPRAGVTSSGVYDPRGRTPKPPVQAQQGRFLDITG